MDDKLIVTIAIETHGSVYTLDLTSETTNLFKNVRLLCGAGGFSTYETDFINSFVLVSQLRNYFARDIGDTESTFSMLGTSKTSSLIGNITYDKVLSTTTSGDNLLGYLSFSTYLEGIYLISVHKGKKLIYPTNSTDIINFLLIKDIFQTTKIFKTEMPDLNAISSKFPNVIHYIDEENSIKNSKKLNENEKFIKLEDVKHKITKSLDDWNLTLDSSGKKIEIIKMSVLVELIKTIISEDCIINLLDYSCNNPSRFIPKIQGPNLKYAMNYDIEQGIPDTKLGGKKCHKKTCKKRNLLKKT
jgi:hypothetical protein